MQESMCEKAFEERKVPEGNERLGIKIYGKGLDTDGRCIHYHTEKDVAALLCGRCRKYYACFSCHDELEDHPFKATEPEEQYPVLCGCCRSRLTKKEYETGSCPHCGAAFNPRCSLHKDIYFCPSK